MPQIINYHTVLSVSQWSIQQLERVIVWKIQLARKLRRSTRSHTLSQIIGSLVSPDEYKQSPEGNFRPLHQDTERDSYKKSPVLRVFKLANRAQAF